MCLVVLDISTALFLAADASEVVTDDLNESFQEISMGDSSLNHP